MLALYFSIFFTFFFLLDKTLCFSCLTNLVILKCVYIICILCTYIYSSKLKPFKNSKFCKTLVVKLMFPPPSSSSSSSFSEHYMNLSHKTMFMTLYMFFLLVFSSCNAAARIEPTKVSEMEIVQKRSRSSRQEIMESFRFKGRVFHFQSKRVLVPPSGPSKRHNSVVNNLKH